MDGTIKTVFGDYSEEAVDHIVRFADAHDLPPLALLAMGLQESNLNPAAEGDLTIGGSGGVFQIFVAAHGGPMSKWEGIDGLDRAMAEMLGRWSQTFADAGGWDGWLADPITFQLNWTPKAQGSIAWTPEMAGRRVGQAIVLLVLYLKGLAISALAARAPAPGAQPRGGAGG